MLFDKLATAESLNKTVKSLEKNGFVVKIAKDKKEAKQIVFGLIPKGTEVLANTSKTLDEIGIRDEIDNSGNYNSVHQKSLSVDREREMKHFKEMRSVADVAIGSFHAVTEKGEIIIASASGSQLSGYAYGADKVIFVAGIQKIVKNLDEGFKRLYEHVLPLESERMMEAYGMPSSPRRILILNSEMEPRTTIVLVKEKLGF